MVEQELRGADRLNGVTFSHLSDCSPLANIGEKQDWPGRRKACWALLISH